jgi:hypothetical protein
VVDALFDVDGGRFIPSAATPGPWGDDLMHGGALGALCVHVLEQAGADDVVPVRFSIDFIRPLLRQPLRIDTEVVRSGKRLELIEGRVRVGDVDIARCTLLSLRPMPVELPIGAVASPQPPPDTPDSFPEPRHPTDGGRMSFFGTGIEVREPEGFQSGKGWFRLRLATIPGVPPSAMARTVGAADFGLGISSFGEWPPKLAFPNADLVVHCARPLQGEWVRVEARSTWNENGVGLCSITLADLGGTLGAAVQSLVLSPTA